MNRDIRASGLYRSVEEFYAAVHAPGTGRITDAADVSVHPVDARIAFTGTIFNDLDSAPVSRACIADADGQNARPLPCSANNALLPRWSPNGEWLAWLTDANEAGNFQLVIAAADDPDKSRTTPGIDGFVEYLHWSPDGSHVLLGVAGFGADLAGCQGGATIEARADESLPRWLPEIETGDADNLWRSIWVYDVAARTTTKVSPAGLNFWEANWLGDDHFVSVVSDSHSEGSWYAARIERVAINGGGATTVFVPDDQVGLPAASPSGRHLAFVEAVCSDRWIVCGTLKIFDGDAAVVTVVDTADAEVTHTHWRDETRLLYCGQRGFDTVVGEYDASTGQCIEHWAGSERTFGAWYPSAWPHPDGGAVVVGESYATPPELVRVGGGRYNVLHSFATEASRAAGFDTARIERYPWAARDGLEIHGWLVRPPGDGPFPLVVDIHGGPVWQCRNRWAGRLRGAKILADHGIASLYPNPRGSSGRGQDFARLVKGDMGGEDTYDYLTACDALVADGTADPDRLGVTGISYGGFMSAWLITQDSRFAAAVPISCVADWYSQHPTSQIPFFDEHFLDGSAFEAGGRFFERSPAMFTRGVTTPTLQLTGAKDQNTPPTQALEFHRSLLEHGARSVLVTYPLAGHGIRGFPEVIDHTTRYVAWFLEHLLDKQQGL